MELQTISSVSKALNLSTRTLRYYEQIGLITSEKKEDYAYRVYTVDTIKRLHQILILRKLRIPLKQIAEILKNNDAKLDVEVFTQNMNEIDEEMTALSTIGEILQNFLTKISESLHTHLQLDILASEDILEIADTLMVSKAKLEENKTIDDLNTASETINKLTDKDVPTPMSHYYLLAQFHAHSN